MSQCRSCKYFIYNNMKNSESISLNKNKLLVMLLTLVGFINITFVSADELPEYKGSQQRYVYNVYYKSMSIGKMIRELVQQNNNKTQVDMFVDLSFLAIGFGGSQSSDIFWDKDSQRFITQRFTRESDGFSNVKMQATFSEK